MSCPDEPHVHNDITLFGLFRGHQLNMDGNPLGLILDATIADRIATLLARHGLADVPENAAEIATPPPFMGTADRSTAQHPRIDPTPTRRPHEGERLMSGNPITPAFVDRAFVPDTDRMTLDKSPRTEVA